MALRKLTGITDNRCTPTRGFAIYRDAEWDEYLVRFYMDGKHQLEADYHTTDRDDAYDTANLWLTKGI